MTTNIQHPKDQNIYKEDTVNKNDKNLEIIGWLEALGRWQGSKK